MINISRCANLIDATGLTLDGSGLNYQNGFMTFSNSSTAGAVNYGAFSYAARLQDVPGYVEFTNMFEQFRLNKIVIRIIPMATSASGSAAPSPLVAQPTVLFHWALDPDDAVLPTASAAGIQVMRERQGYRVRNILQGGGRPITIVLRPHFAKSIYSSAVATGYQAAKGWLDNGAWHVPHYGVKCIAESVSGGAAGTQYFKVETKYFLSFKGLE